MKNEAEKTLATSHDISQTISEIVTAASGCDISDITLPIDAVCIALHDSTRDSAETFVPLAIQGSVTVDSYNINYAG